MAVLPYPLQRKPSSEKTLRSRQKGGGPIGSPALMGWAKCQSFYLHGPGIGGFLTSLVVRIEISENRRARFIRWSSGPARGKKQILK